MQILTEQFYHKIPKKPAENISWKNLQGSSKTLAIATLAETPKFATPIIVITKDIQTANQLEQEISFFLTNANIPITIFPDWETLPYDHFSPHQDIISQRLLTLYQALNLSHGIIFTSINSLLSRLPPRSYLENSSFVLKIGDKLNLENFRLNLEKRGYYCVNKVMEHGEFAVRGSIIDIFPTGSDNPFRIDLFDDEIESIRLFDPDTQRTTEKITTINLLPAKEFPLTTDAISHFRQNWRNVFGGDPTRCPIYQSVSAGEAPNGIEYYLPLFFDTTATFFDYLPQNSLIIFIDEIYQTANTFIQDVKLRFEELRHDIEHPILAPNQIYLTVDQVFGELKKFPQITIEAEHSIINNTKAAIDFNITAIPNITINYKDINPLEKLSTLINASKNKILFCAETAGRRESLLEVLNTKNIFPATFASWKNFLEADAKIGITIAPIVQGFLLDGISVITEAELFGQQIVIQKRASKQKILDPENIIRDLAELNIGSPVVHIQHGIGRYLGLQTLRTDNIETEFLTLEYADSTKLYVPVSSLHLISRYTGADPENAPYSNLGTKQWEKIKRKVAEKVRDVAAELLDLYAKRAAKTGFKFDIPSLDYKKFVSNFPFEETYDQQKAINDVINDMAAAKAMDRLICGDVGFGKTEVAMRAAFIAAFNSKQVVVLCPTTILAQQHFSNFQDRFADWPFKIELLSRFRSKTDQNKILEQLKEGKIDIIIGTHKLIQKSVIFNNLGLLIIDEEHRFGVKQKERIKELRPEVDVLTLTATPIPRTLNMAFAGIRDFSIIATPPARRLSIKTFFAERENSLIHEAILRETLRGGQVYFLHNAVNTIEKTAQDLQKILPSIRIAIAHGQMREHQLEKIMGDFYHQRYNVLVCTTIIESGIDIPTANTIIIDKANHFGLAQLHQLRGRVGRSHHQAYAYLLVSSKKTLTADAKKRMEAITSMEDLGAGFSLATHDLEIRGAGELLGEDQSGQIESIGFSLYMDYLDRAILALKNGEQPDLDQPPFHITEIDLHIATIIPENYVNDISSRLTLYKRIANAKNNTELDDLKEEIIDRFGNFPESTKNLFKITRLRLNAEKLGIRKITSGTFAGTIEFGEKPNIDPKIIINLIQKQSTVYKIKGNNKLEFQLPENINNQAEKKIEFVENLLNMFNK